VDVQNGGKIGTITNSGLIQSIGAEHGINIKNNTTIEVINNTGTISGNNGIFITTDKRSGSTVIDNIINNGTIISNGARNSGIKIMYGAQIKTINNENLILTSGSGVSVLGWNNNGKNNIDTLNNSGTIKYIGSANIDIRDEEYGQGAGIFMANYNGLPKVGTINNSGLIDTYNGIYLALGTQVGTINNSGTIIARKDGIVLGNNKDSNENRQSIIESLNNTGTIQAGRYGIFVDVASNSNVPFQIGNIETKGVISGGQVGVYIGTKQQINNYIKLDGSDALIAGGTAGIHNKGTIGVNNNNGSLVNSNTGNVIDLQNGATIAAISNDGKNLYTNSSGTAILNEGTIKGNISLDGGSKIIGAIDNKNIITGSIDLKNKSHIDSIINSGTIEKGINLNQSTIGSIANSGSIGNGGIKLNDSTITSIENTETGKTNLDLKNNSIVDLVINNGEMEITRDDSSLIKAFGNNGNVKSEFKNDGVMTAVNNSENAIMEQGLSNSGAIDA
ncbi:TPA: hypothetical protein R1706_001562, partial [Campylobacter lari]|nr:hypothetical protein [Campylobacter lari]